MCAARPRPAKSSTVTRMRRWGPRLPGAGSDTTVRFGTQSRGRADRRRPRRRMRVGGDKEILDGTFGLSKFLDHGSIVVATVARRHRRIRHMRGYTTLSCCDIAPRSARAGRVSSTAMTRSPISCSQPSCRRRGRRFGRQSRRRPPVVSLSRAPIGPSAELVRDTTSLTRPRTLEKIPRPQILALKRVCHDVTNRAVMQLNMSPTRWAIASTSSLKHMYGRNADGWHRPACCRHHPIARLYCTRGSARPCTHPLHQP